MKERPEWFRGVVDGGKIDDAPDNKSESESAHLESAQLATRDTEQIDADIGVINLHIERERRGLNAARSVFGLPPADSSAAIDGLRSKLGVLHAERAPHSSEVPDSPENDPVIQEALAKVEAATRSDYGETARGKWGVIAQREAGSFGGRDRIALAHRMRIWDGVLKNNPDVAEKYRGHYQDIDEALARQDRRRNTEERGVVLDEDIFANLPEIDSHRRTENATETPFGSGKTQNSEVGLSPNSAEAPARIEEGVNSLEDVPSDQALTLEDVAQMADGAEAKAELGELTADIVREPTFEKFAKLVDKARESLPESEAQYLTDSLMDVEEHILNGADLEEALASLHILRTKGSEAASTPDSLQHSKDTEAVRNRRIETLVKKFPDAPLDAQSIDRTATNENIDRYTAAMRNVFDTYADKVAAFKAGRVIGRYSYEKKRGGTASFERNNIDEEMLEKLKNFADDTGKEKLST